MSSSGNKDTESGLSPDSQEVREDSNGFKSKITQKDCRSVVDLRDNRDRSPYSTLLRFGHFGQILAKCLRSQPYDFDKIAHIGP